MISRSSRRAVLDQRDQPGQRARVAVARGRDQVRGIGRVGAPRPRAAPDGGAAASATGGHGTRSSSASPWPPPPQSAAAPRPPPRRRSSWARCSTIRAPDMPIGWPIAIAPPLTLTLSGPTPRSRMDWMRDRGERLVDLDQVQVGHAQPGLAERAGDGVRRLRLQRVVRAGHHAVRADLGQHRRPGGRGRLGRHHHDRAGAVGDLRGGAGGDRAVRGRTRGAAGQRLRGGVGPHALVGVEDHRLAAPLRDGDRRDLLGAAARS